jgi:hypothetical protein
MSKYTVQKYIEKKWSNIAQDSPTCKAYNLGVAVGMLETYRAIKKCWSKEDADAIFQTSLDEDNEYVTILRTLIKLDNDEYASTAERIAEKLYKYKQDQSQPLSDEDAALLEEFADFIHRKENNQC